MKNLITRKQWDARRPKRVDVLAPSAVQYLVVHYSASDADEQSDHRNCAARVRGIQRFHRETRGWNDIAYNWLVCKHGYIFRGRGWRTRSAATGPANRYSVAVCFLGDDTANRDDITDKGCAAILEVLAFVKRNAPRFRGIRGHRDFMATTCPGNQLYQWLKTL